MPGPLRNLLAGMIISGTATYNQEQQEHGSREQISVLKYLSTGDFVEATRLRTGSLSVNAAEN